MSLVLDASVTLAWYFPEEQTPATHAVLDRVAADHAVAPSLWRVEVANVLQLAVRRQRLTASRRDQAIAALRVLPIEIDPDCDRFAWTTTLELSDRFALTTYDATYLELAWRRQLPLASRDVRLGEAARALGLKLLGAG